MANRRDKIPQSVFGRTSRLLMSGAKIAAREVAGRLGGEDSKLATKIRQTEELVTTLSQLKGAAMKAGQMLSLEFSDLLPPEVLAVLRRLHDSSTFMPFDQVRYILTRELGADKLAEFEDLSPEPIAAASIGQVHKATLRGAPVAVKIQFPGVAKSIDSDLSVLRRIVALGLQMRGKAVDMTPVFEELAAGLKREADYRLEATSAEEYRRLIVGDDFVVPTIQREFSTEKVLTMSFETGQRLTDWIKSGPDRASVDHFASLVIELVIQEFLATGLMQTDPNFGNFLYRPESGKIVLLDFGATNHYPADFRSQIRSVMRLAMVGDIDGLLAFAYDFGLLDRRESPATLVEFRALITHILSMFQPQFQPFHFRDDSWLKELREITTRFIYSVSFTVPDKRLMFINRKLSGMFHLLKDLDAVIDMTPVLLRCLSIDIR